MNYDQASANFADRVPEPHGIKRRIYSIVLEEFCVGALLYDVT